MKTDIQKQIELRTGEILRQYTDFDGHLKNFIQQFHIYDLLLICQKIYSKLQETRTKRVDFSTIEMYISTNCKTKNYRKSLIEKPNDFEPYERVNFEVTYNKIWKIISQPFKYDDSDEKMFW